VCVCVCVIQDLAAVPRAAGNQAAVAEVDTQVTCESCR